MADDFMIQWDIKNALEKHDIEKLRDALSKATPDDVNGVKGGEGYDEPAIFMASTTYIFEDKACEITRLLLQSGADVNAKNKDGVTALHIAARYGHLVLAKLLLDHGANVNSCCDENFSLYSTPLIATISSHHVAMTELLLKNGADCLIKHNGKTALDLAKECDFSGVIAMMEGRSVKNLPPVKFEPVSECAVMRRIRGGYVEIEQVFDFEGRQMITSQTDILRHEKPVVETKRFAEIEEKSLIHQAYRAFRSMGGQDIDWERPEKQSVFLPDFVLPQRLRKGNKPS